MYTGLYDVVIAETLNSDGRTCPLISIFTSFSSLGYHGGAQCRIRIAEEDILHEHTL